jgi:RNA polymerase sigma-70 factor (ECF subfamily)
MNHQPDPVPKSIRPFVISAEDQHLLASLRGGDEAAFTMLVDQYYMSMLRIATLYVSDASIAEDVVQETWVAVLRGLTGFEGRSSLKTWIFTILTNRAKTRGQREERRAALASPFDTETEGYDPAVSADRFRSADDPEWPHHWRTDSKPVAWTGLPEDTLVSQETLALVFEAIEALPPAQREVIRLRDLEGWSASEVCNILEITETNQRVLLHRARSKVRQALEGYFANE